MSNSPPSTLKVVLAGFVGTAVEWYDFFLYGFAAALVFDKLFFPKLDPVVGVMASFATFAVGFFSRPLGGVIFGHFGDRLGRKSTLVASLVMMGAATFLIGLLPTHTQIGWLAPALLVLLRFVQGIGVGGEWGGAVLLAVEHGGSGGRGLRSSLVQVGVPVGQLLAAAAFTLTASMNSETFMAWGWRIPFLAGGALVIVGLLVRFSVLESPLFEKAKTAGPAKLPVIEVLQKHWKNVLLAMGARMAENGSYYIFTVYSLSYAVERLGLPKNALPAGVLISSAVGLITLPFFGWLSDRVGRRPVYMLGAAGVGLFAWPFFLVLDTKNIGLIWFTMAAGMGTFHAAMYGSQAAFFAELFGTRVRYSGVSLGYQLASPFAGGIAPFVAAALLRWSGGDPWPIAVYIVLMVVITLVSVSLARETSRGELG